MPYRRFRRGYHRTGGFYGRFNSGGAHQERKFLDTAWNDATVAANGTAVNDDWTDIAQGVSESQRIGRQCYIHSIHVKGHFHCADTSGTHERLRVVLVWDKQCNGALPSWGDVFEATNIDTFRNIQNVHRFKVLIDRTYTINKVPVNPYDSNTTYYQIPAKTIMYNYRFPRPGLRMDFSSSTGATSEKVTNNVIGFLMAENAEKVNWTSNVRIRFSDNAKGMSIYRRRGRMASLTRPILPIGYLYGADYSNVPPEDQPDVDPSEEDRPIDRPTQWRSDEPEHLPYTGPSHEDTLGP